MGRNAELGVDGGIRVRAPPEFGAYRRAFAAGRYFEAHEHLESLWWSSGSDPFLHGLILFAAAHVKLQRGQAVGAARHFAAAARYLEPYAPASHGVDVAALIAHAGRAAQRLSALPAGADPREAVAPYRFPPRTGHQWGSVARPAVPALADAVAAVLDERHASGVPTGGASWAPVVKEVTRRTAGAYPRPWVREAVRSALAGWSGPPSP